MKAAALASLCALAACLGAQSPLEQARSDYVAQRYEAAREGFVAALGGDGLDDVAILTAIGNCSFRLGRHAEATVAYRRALLRAPGDPTARTNLELANARLGLDPEPESAFERLDAREWLMLALVLQLAGFGLCVLARSRRSLRVLGVAVGAVGFLSALRVGAIAWAPRAVQAVVLAPELPLLSGLEAPSTVVWRLHAGDVVEVRRREGAAVLVRVGGTEGFVDATGIGVIDDP